MFAFCVMFSVVCIINMQIYITILLVTLADSPNCEKDEWLSHLVFPK